MELLWEVLLVKIIEEHGENAAEPLKEYVSAMKTAAMNKKDKSKLQK